ncbi:hypothetical protein CDL15_Pgr024427 [Punica granatum]|uniref:Serine-threonine/tyrosine-protein kinase catalytic domain-containing protein n=1 Tax=Punica granatum TaxID=22663 RepID=A0A218XYK3_PUNGR|nr:hypothetical protein CDL15_Pgr024427 [Punica granatum]
MPTKALLKKKKKDQAKSDKSSPATLVRTSLRLGDEPRTGGKENGRRRGSREETEGEEEAKKRRQFRTSPGDFDMEGSRCCSLCNAATEKKRTKTGVSFISLVLKYGAGAEVSTHGDVHSYGILVLEMFTWKRPTDDMFRDGPNPHLFAKAAFPDRVLQIIDPVLLQESHDEDDGRDIRRTRRSHDRKHSTKTHRRSSGQVHQMILLFKGPGNGPQSRWMDVQVVQGHSGLL